MATDLRPPTPGRAASFKLVIGDEGSYTRRLARLNGIRFMPASVTSASEPLDVSGRRDWLYNVLRTLRMLVLLPQNYDDNQGKPVALESAIRAASILATLHPYVRHAPQLVPVGDGFVMVEWHTEGADFEIEVGTEGQGSLFAQREGGQWRFESETLQPYVADLPALARFLNLAD